MQPGETEHVEVATHGRIVVGRIELDEGLAGRIKIESLDESFARGLAAEGYSTLDRPRVPAKFDTADKRAKWYLDWYNNTEAGRQRKAMLAKGRAVMIHADGTFISEKVEPGNYVFEGSLRDGRIVVCV